MPKAMLRVHAMNYAGSEHGRRQIGQIGEEFSRLGVGKRGSRETAGDAEGNVKGARDELRREIYKGEIDRGQEGDGEGEAGLFGGFRFGRCHVVDERERW